MKKTETELNRLAAAIKSLLNKKKKRVGEREKRAENTETDTLVCRVLSVCVCYYITGLISILTPVRGASPCTTDTETCVPEYCRLMMKVSRETCSFIR